MDLIYDCEIIKMIPSKEAAEKGFEYCAGWEDYENMGISVICATGLYSDEASMVFLHPTSSLLENHSYTIHDFSSYVDGCKLYGFNSRKFDDKLCQANGIDVSTSFDLLEQVRLSAYGSIEWFDCPKGYTYKLDALAKANGLGGKTGSGELAPKLWQQGKQQEVVDYCLHDVQLTKQLVIKFLDGELIDPNTGKRLIPRT